MHSTINCQSCAPQPPPSLGTSDPDEATGEPANDDCANQLWSGPAAARTAVILDTDSGAHRVVLAAGEGLQVYDVGVGSWQRCPGFDGVQVQSLDFALDAASGARLLVAGGWRLGSGPQLLLSRGAMAGTPATACEWLVRDLPSSGPASVMGPMGSCLVRVDPANPQRLYALVLPSPVNRSSQAPAPAGDMEAAWPARPAAGGDVLCVSHDLGATWQVQMVTGRATPLLRLTGLALSANRPGRLMLTGTIPALAPGHVPVGSQDGITPDRPVVLYRCADPNIRAYKEYAMAQGDNEDGLIPHVEIRVLEQGARLVSPSCPLLDLSPIC